MRQIVQRRQQQMPRQRRLQPTEALASTQKVHGTVAGTGLSAVQAMWALSLHLPLQLHTASHLRESHLNSKNLDWTAARSTSLALCSCASARLQSRHWRAHRVTKSLHL